MIGERKAIKINVENRLKQLKEFEDIDGRICFRTATGGFLRLDTLGGRDNCIVIEYADNRMEANNNRFEDGDLFSIEEYSEDAIFTEVLDAIETY